MANKKDVTKHGKTVMLGPQLIKLLDKQRERVRDVTYGCVETSYYDAGEIIAKKIKN